MPFSKTGEAPIVGVFCKCGQQLCETDKDCPNCGNDLKKCDNCCGDCDKKDEEKEKDD